MIPVAFGILVITFSIGHLVGDPAQVLAPEDATPAQVDEVREQLGLNRPVVEQFTSYVGGLFRGDLGTSFVQRRPVESLIRDRLWPTLLLTVSALTVSIPLGVGLGVMIARRASGVMDFVVRTGALIGYGIPSFWLAQIAVLVLVFRAGVFPVVGMTDAHITSGGLDHIIDVGHHLFLPALVLAASEVALLIRITRSGLLQSRNQDYTRTARAKGVTEADVTSHHVLPNALLPVVTVIGSRVGLLFSGAVLVETVFAWPGLGTLLIESARSHDEPVVLAMVLMTAGAVMFANLVTDLVYAWIDPRVSYT